jgi:hypothetical protein
MDPDGDARALVSDAARTRALAAGLAVLTLTSYLITLNPSVPGGDSGELIVAAQTLASAHPTGYPLYVLVAKTFTWLPFGSVAWRVNLFSAACDTLAAVLLMLAVTRLTRHRWAGAVAGALFALSPTVWTFATAAEVFPLNNAIVALQIYLATLAWETGDARFVYATAFAVGLGGANHVTSGVTGVILLAAVIWHTRAQSLRLHTLAMIAMAGAAGLLPYAWLPIASSAAHPSPAQWGDQTTITGFLDHVLRREYGTLRLGGVGFEGRISTTSQLMYYARDAAMQLAWVGAALAVAGVYRSYGDRRLRGPVIAGAMCWAAFLLAFHSFANLPIDQPFFHGVVARFWQQPNVFLCAAAGLGFAALVPRRGRWTIAFALMCVALPVALHARAANHRDDWTIRDYGAELLRPLPDGALVLTRGDLILNSARYVHEIEQVRSDVAILDLEMLTFKWMKPLVAKQHPEIVLPGSSYRLAEPGTFNLRQLVEANITSRPVVICGGVRKEDTSLDAAFELWPLGLCSEVRRRGAAVDLADWLRRSDAALPSFRAGTNPSPPADSWEYVAWTDYWGARHSRAFWLLTKAIANGDQGSLRQAAALFDGLIAADPSPRPYYFKNSGIAHARIATGDPAEARKAIESWNAYLRVAPADDADVPAIRTAIGELQQSLR